MLFSVGKVFLILVDWCKINVLKVGVVVSDDWFIWDMFKLRYVIFKFVFENM